MTSFGLDATHEPTLRSWVGSANGHRDFPIQNLPFGVFSPDDAAPRAGLAIGDKILDLRALAGSNLLASEEDETRDALRESTLNALLALPAERRRQLRQRLSALLAADSPAASQLQGLLHPTQICALHLPTRIGDYTDFYVGIHHAANVGRLFRPDNPLLPNYKHVPIGYHGRASSVRASGAPVIRPLGQAKASDASDPQFGPTQRLDYEAEFGVWVGQGNALGQPIPIDRAPEHIAGFCLLNDWSARDLQAWEYQPLGPFLAKNFITTVSPWVVTAEALAPFRIPQPPRADGDPRPLAYLWDDGDQTRGGFAVELEVSILTPTMRERGIASHRLSRSALSNMYWTVAQMVAHHTSNGCNLGPGDLLGSGTISAATKNGYGSLLELTAGGREPVPLPSGETRAFLEDGDELILTGLARREGHVPIGFGACRGVVQPGPAL